MKKKLQLKTETVAALSSDSIARVRGGLCYESARTEVGCQPYEPPPAPLSCGYCQRG